MKNSNIVRKLFLALIISSCGFYASASVAGNDKDKGEKQEKTDNGDKEVKGDSKKDDSSDQADNDSSENGDIKGKSKQGLSTLADESRVSWKTIELK